MLSCIILPLPSRKEIRYFQRPPAVRVDIQNCQLRSKEPQAMSWLRRLRRIVVIFTLFALPACQQWVSPYSAELQKRATDMLAEVSAWESTMGRGAGTVAADPRNPAVSGQLDKWQGEIEAMAAIEAGIDPGAGTCDKVVQGVLGGVGGFADKLLKAAPATPALASSSPPASLQLYCESLPSIFEKMMNQVTTIIPSSLGEQCKVPWIDDSYFSGKSSVSGADAPKPPGNAEAQRKAAQTATQRCHALFEVLPGTSSKHGDLVSTLVVALESIIYREGRQAPAK
jgi:hypothetical protein